ncbi:MAG: lytic transglycosylase domain-containing protein [Spirochaetales bacterium]|nr:MAG: lytic transglycosylase domain-containing protein [Spirochaetales bacterium]
MRIFSFTDILKPIGGSVLLVGLALLYGGCTIDNGAETSVSAYIPSGFMELSGVEEGDYSKAVSETAREDHIGRFYANEATREATISFFTNLTSSRTVAVAILEASSKSGVPPGLAFALVHEESDYKTAATGHNSDSIDRGLFQLNSRSFPKLTSQDFFDPRINARYGTAHLAFCLEAGGNEVAALAMYNAGQGRVSKGGTPRRTLDYIYRIISYRANLETLFEAQVVARFAPSSAGSNALAFLPDVAPRAK